MKIKSPILRFVAGVAVLSGGAAVIVSLLYGLGKLTEPWYAQRYPSLYENYGYSFSDAIFYGAIVAWTMFVAVWVVWMGIRLGNRLFGPKK